MGSYRIPGPYGLHFAQSIDAGTSCLQPSGPPGTLWLSGPEMVIPPQPTVTLPGYARGLTPGEIAMAATIFKNSLDYGAVKVHNEEFLWFGIQDDDTAMTPDGEMYFNPKHFKEDFSTSTFGDRIWFMHEMTHVWQHQLGYPVMLRGAIRIGLGYDYELSAKNTLDDYNMEAQGDLLADYWALKTYGKPPWINQPKYINSFALYEKVLAKFIANPADTSNLP